MVFWLQKTGEIADNSNITLYTKLNKLFTFVRKCKFYNLFKINFVFKFARIHKLQKFKTHHYSMNHNNLTIDFFCSYFKFLFHTVKLMC